LWLVEGQPALAQRGARLFDAGWRRRQPGQAEHACGRRLEGGLGAARPGEEPAGRRVAGDRAVAHHDDAIRRGQAPLEAVLGQDDRRPPLLVQPPQEPDQLVAGDRIQLRGRLVQQHQPGSARQRRAQRDALQLATAQLARRPVEQVRDPERQRGLLHAPRHRRRPVPAVLQRERELRAHGRQHDLGLGVLEQRAGDARDGGRPVLAGVEPADPHHAAERASVEVRHQPGGRPQERGLATGRRPGQDHQLALADAQRHVAQRRCVGARVGVGDALEGQQLGGHGAIPRRSANGSSATIA
jgi:hypothetical protein